MNEWVQTAIVYIDLIVTGSEAHISRKASQGGGNLWRFFIAICHIIYIYIHIIYLFFYYIALLLRHCHVYILLLTCMHVTNQTLDSLISWKRFC